MPLALRLHKQTFPQVNVFMVRLHRELEDVARRHEVRVLVREDDEQVFGRDPRAWCLSRKENAATGGGIGVYVEIAIALVMGMGRCKNAVSSRT